MARVIKTFRDKETRRIYLPEQQYKTDDEKYLNLLFKQGYIHDSGIKIETASAKPVIEKTGSKVRHTRKDGG